MRAVWAAPRGGAGTMPPVTRIVAGVAGGRRLAVPPSGTRPTSDRVREALFSALAHDPGLDGAAVLDLCAGSGALGLEALSRGAAHVLLVESDRRAAAVLRRNVAAVGSAGRAGAGRPGGGRPRRPADRAYDLLLVDPPYALPTPRWPDGSPRPSRTGGSLDDATVVVERPTRGGPFPWPAPLQPLRERRYGETTLHLGRCYGRQP